jgi:tetratricopeptide (TPR) repeat protein
VLFRSTLSVARRVGDDATLARVLNLRHDTIQMPGTVAERLANTAENLELTARLGDPLERFWAVNFRLRATAEAGLVEEVDWLLAELERLSRELGQPALRWYAAFRRAWRGLLAGRLEEAERLCLEALQIGNDCGQPDAVAVYAAQIAMVRRDQGRVAELEPVVAQAAADNPGIPGFRALLALCYCDLDRLSDARRIFAVDAADGFGAIPYDMVWSSAMAMYAEVCSALQEPESALLITERLEPFTGIMADNGATSFGVIDRYLGLLAGTLDRFEEAEARFAAATEFHQRIGAPVWLARTLLDWGRLLQRREEHDRAEELLQRSVALARSHGSVLLAEKARRTLAKGI